MRPDLHPQMFSSRTFPASIVVFVATVLVGIPAAAAPLPRLIVVRAAEAADCPDAVTLASAVERQMQRPALDPTNENVTAGVYEVRITRSPEGYAATIHAGELTRDLSDPGSTCAELGEALALTLTILLENEPSPAPPVPPLPPPIESPRALPPPTSPPKKLPAPKPIRDWNAGVNVGIGETVGFLSPLSFAMSADGWFRFRRASFGIGVWAIPHDRVGDSGTATVVLRLVTGTLHACGRIAGRPAGVHFSLCGQSFFGTVRGEGQGYVENRAGTRPWMALGAMGSLEGPLRSSLGWSIRATLAIPAVSQRFIVQRETPVTVFEPSSVAGFLGIGLRWTIF